MATTPQDPGMFEYRPLDVERREIRLIRFQPREGHDSLEDSVLDITIEHVSLNDQPEYLALSYVWGDPTPCHPISLNGKHSGITKNLLAALIEIEKQQPEFEIATFALWVDSLCIQQSDDIEKSSQVQLMSTIFGIAQSVIAWLGPEADGSDQAMEWLDEIGKEVFWDFVERALDAKGQATKLQKASLEWFPVLYHLEASAQLPPKALTCLFERPYWSRIWILQEIAVAESVVLVCGRRRSTWDRVEPVYILLTQYQWYYQANKGQQGASLFDVPNYPKQMMSATCALIPRSHDRWLSDVVGSVYRDSWVFFQASDPRDKVFALLGLATDAENVGLRADYSMSCEVVYYQLTIYLISCLGLNLLSYCAYFDPMLGLPSWVPNWNMPFLSRLWGGKTALFSVAPRSRPTPSVLELVVLQVRGVRIDSVRAIGITGVNLVEDARPFLHSFSELVELSGNCYTTKDKSEAVWRTPIADRECSALETRRATEKSLASWMELTETSNHDKTEEDKIPKILEDSTSAESANEELDGIESSKVNQIPPYPEVDEGGFVYSYANILYDTAFLRRGFVSSKGYLGLGPQYTREGDIMVIIFGADMPYILRKLENGQYMLIGEAYVHGIMDGEFMQTNPEPETFDIR